MGPFLTVILAAFLSTLALDLGGKPDEVDRTTATVLAIGMIASAWLTSRVHHARAPGSFRPPPWARPIDLAFFGLLLFGTDWTTVAREATLDLPLLRQLMVLAPYVLAALARVEAAWPAEHSDQHPWSRGRAVAFHARLLLMPIAPLLVINAALDVLRRIGAVGSMLAAYPAFEFGLVVAFFVVVVATMPVVLTWILGSKPLPPGALRSALEADLARQRVRVGGIEQVDTGGLIANAAYLGLVPRLGRIFISDALLRGMPEDETRAVFAHEVAHGTRRHLVWFLALFTALILSMYVVEGLLVDTWWSVLVAMSVPMVAGIVAFVAISRRFEVEADLVGADTLGDPALFNRALVRVATIAGKPLDRHGLRHYSIGARTAIVHACAADHAVRAHWGRRIRSAKLAIMATLGLVLLGVAWKLPADLKLGGARQARMELMPSATNGLEQLQPDRVQRFLAAVDDAREALGHPAVRREAAEVGIAVAMGLADEALKRGDFDEARRIAADVDANWPTGDPLGDFNRKMLRVELAALDPSRDLASLHPEVAAVQAEVESLLSAYPAARNESSDLVQRELRFLAAATDPSNAPFAYEADTFGSSRLLALARGAKGEGVDSIERAHADYSKDHAWRRIVLERALGGRSPEGVRRDLFAAETRRGAG
jgi:Zn-dependent protease with chaperone function